MVRAAITGLGAVAPLHIEALLSAGIEITSVCDTDRDKANSVVKQYGLSAKVFTDHREMTETGGFDAVHICTPHYLHTEMILDALNNGCHVLCEKPLCIDSGELPVIDRAVLKSGKTLGVCFQNRYNPSTRLLDDYLKGRTIDAASATVFWQRTAEYYQNDAWRGKTATEGGGVLINQAIHTLDLLIKFCGMPRSVTASMSNLSLKDVIEVEDTAVLHCGGDPGFDLFATNAAKCNFPVELRFRSGGDDIVLSTDYLSVNGQRLDLSGKMPKRDKQYYGGGHSELIRDFYAHIGSGRKFPIDHTEGGKSMIVLSKAYKSNGKELNI